jgi:Delta3-Delta2-enoyl-CoA isomerase
MLLTLFDAFQAAENDPETKVVVLTGTGKYYCAGVDLSGTIKPMHPAELHNMIKTSNQKVFDTFLKFPKPIIAAVNGPAIGASVTTTTLCDHTIAGESATFLTPFARLGVPPEGCSSVHFEFLMGKEGDR